MESDVDLPLFIVTKTTTFGDIAWISGTA